jgi:hypothetical protein
MGQHESDGRNTMIVRRVIVLGAGVLAGVFALAGCFASADDDLDDEKAATTASALDVGTSSTELGELTSADPVEAARGAAASKTKGCRTRAVDAANPNVVHVTLDGCTGRFGRHVVSGHLTVTFSANPDGSLHSSSVSQDLTVDGRPFSRTVTADITLAGDLRHVSRHSEKTGTKRNGDSLVQSEDEVVVVDRSTRCRTVNGTGHALVGGSRNITSTTTNLQTCETAEGEDLCPTGTIEHVNEAKGKTRVASFDGSSSATIEISKRKGSATKVWSLDCTPR